MNLCISLFWLRWAESTTRLARPIWKSWSVVSESAMLRLQDEVFATFKDIFQILRQCNCNMQAFPPKAVKHMSWLSHNISSCDIYENYIGNCLTTRMVAILFFFIACEKTIPPFLLLVNSWPPYITSGDASIRPVMHQVVIRKFEYCKVVTGFLWQLCDIRLRQSLSAPIERFVQV